jgi:hypothetical protein
LCPLACSSRNFCSPQLVFGGSCYSPNCLGYGVCFIYALVVVFFFVSTDTFCFKSSLGVTVVRVFWHSFELDLRGYARDLATRSPLCCSPSASVPAASTSGGVEPPCSECGLHAPRCGLNVWATRPFPAGWVVFSGRIVDCLQQRRPGCGAHAGVRVVPPLADSAFCFLFCTVYSSLLSQFTFVMG